MPHEKTFCPYGSLMACEFLKVFETKGGIHLPDVNGDDIGPEINEVRKAIVIAIGPEVKYYKVDDIILMRRGQFLKHRDQKYAMIEEADTFGCENRELESLAEDELVDVRRANNLKRMIFEILKSAT